MNTEFCTRQSNSLQDHLFLRQGPRFEQAWDAIAVYLLNDSRWKDDPNVLENIAGVDKMIGDKDFEAWSPLVIGGAAATYIGTTMATGRCLQG